MRKPVAAADGPAADYDLQQVAAALHLSTRWVRNKIKEDHLEHQRYGNRIMFTAEQVDKLKARYTHQPIPQSVTTGRKKAS